MRRKTQAALAASVAMMTMLAGCGNGFDDSATDTTDGLTNDSSQELTVLIGSSGDAETEAVRAAVEAWCEESGQSATVQVANDLTQQLSQGFAGGDPADVFYLAPEQLAGYASNGSLLAYGDYIDTDGFYDNLLQTFTYDGEVYAAPKDVSTLQLVINTDMWSEAGLTEDDYPTTWDELAEVAATLTTDEHVGLAFSGEYARIGVFMKQAGGGLVSDDGTTAIANTDETVEGLQEVKTLLESGNAAYAADLGTGWGGEAFGTGAAAMAIEGNWLTGSMSADYPDVNYTVVELPEGPAGKGTMHFTNGWGIAADSPNQEGAVSLVEYLTSDDVVMDFAEAFGIMPASTTLADTWKSAFPELSAFMDGLDYSVTVPTAQGASDVITEFNAQIEGLKSGDVQSILDDTQTNLEAIL
ncbi:sugar ABC transporter substrate-binding protein [Bifidobacterium eulemuris]|uniref:ABC transporter substrate-binding protein n=1 Tax=Bifidobacterium eulemuris TaxID=1765219 RepID=A0A261GBY1_9BIFI|nr:ABC transporter substrate-binding protein [Bifidobacterium eulemuris]OZG68675.1 sugar ABC transporter substrate-binding protein [Bifidobacterium eulemuris]QOL32788.1 ABC transporter substrate-binding protein [Bifidobacterium eulemuris]